MEMEGLFKQEESLGLGRVMVSLREFQRGEVVWEETSLLIGPSAEATKKMPYTCVGCCKNISEELRCPNCKLPCCSDKCSSNKDHIRFECSVYKQRKIPFSAEYFRDTVLLRALMYKRIEPAKYEAILQLSDDFTNMSPKALGNRNHDARQLWLFATVECGLDVTYAEVMRIVSIFCINNFEIDQDGYNGNGLFGTSSIFPHNCAPNMQFSFFHCVAENGEVDWSIRFRARRNIAKGEMLSIAYAPDDLQKGTALRQSGIRESMGFTCKCNRCLDKTEGGTFFSAVVCSACEEGNLLPINPTNIAGTIWKCDICSEMQDHITIKMKIVGLQSDPHLLSAIEKGDKSTVQKADDFIASGIGLLHHNHYLNYLCAIHWLRFGEFVPVLLTPARDDLLKKIVARARHFIPIAYEIEQPFKIIDVLCSLTRVFAAYYFDSSDMISISMEAPLQDRVTAAKQIVFLLNEASTWMKISACNCKICDDRRNYIKEMLPLWTARFKELQEEDQPAGSSSSAVS